MTRQLGLDLASAPALARKSDPDTSSTAAGSLSADDLSELQGLILGHLRSVGREGATTLELSAALNLDRVTVSPRLAPMAERGVVKDSGRRRAGPSGRPSIVWIATKLSTGSSTP